MHREPLAQPTLRKRELLQARASHHAGKRDAGERGPQAPGRRVVQKDRGVVLSSQAKGEATPFDFRSKSRSAAAHFAKRHEQRQIVEYEVRYVMVLHDPPRERPGPAIQIEPEDRVVFAKVVVRVGPDRVVKRLAPALPESFRVKEVRSRQFVGLKHGKFLAQPQSVRFAGTDAMNLKMPNESTRLSPMMSVSGATAIAPSRPVPSCAKHRASVSKTCWSVWLISLRRVPCQGGRPRTHTTRQFPS